ncbi:MAG: hypothetical protein MUE68_05615 [Bacteroidetes bacterium]|jgi:hypothetical protein|nr:hypothetical protein [Bacteroidota bacterium]
MRSVLITLFLLVAATAAAPAQTKTWEGYLADQMCGSNWKGAKGEERAAKHSRACGLEESCAASGYGVFSGGTFVKFTEASSPKAKVYLEMTAAKNNIYVKVLGVLEGDKISVTSIEAAKPKAVKKGAASKEPSGSHGGASSNSCDCCGDGGKTAKHGAKGHTCDGDCQKPG